MIPLRLEIKDTFSHANSVVDFSILTPVTLVIGEVAEDGSSNGAGKSSTFEALCWAIYGKCRAVSLSDVVRDGRDDRVADVSLQFEGEDGRAYLIQRQADVSQTKALNLYVWEGELWKDISGKTKSDTQLTIEEVVGAPYEVFRNSVYFQQGLLDNFCQMAAGGRKKILEDLLGLALWDRLRERARDAAKALEARISASDAAVQGMDVGDQEQITDAIRAKESSISALTKGVQDNKKTVKDLHRLQEAEEDFNEQRLRVSIIVRDLERKETQCKNCEVLEASATAQRDKVQKALDGIEGTDEQHTAKKLILEDRLSKLDEENKGLYSQMGVAEAKEKECVDRLGLLAEGDVCYVCETDLGPGGAEHLRKQLEEERAKASAERSAAGVAISKNLGQQKAVKVDIGVLDNSVYNRQVLGEKFVQHQAEITRQQDQQIELRLDVGGLKKKEVKEREHQNELSGRLSGLRLAAQAGEAAAVEAQKLEDALQTAEATLQDAEADLQERRDSLAGLRKDLDNAVKAAERVKGMEADIQQMRVEMADYGDLQKIFGSSGVPLEVMKKALVDLERETNTVLRELTDGGHIVKFTTFKENKDHSVSALSTLDVQIHDSLRWRAVSTFSGGEQAIISIAIRVGLSRLLMLQTGLRFNLLFIDEGLGSLDDVHKDKVVDLVNFLGHEHKVLVITHMRDLQTRFPHTLKVVMTNGVSRVEQAGVVEEAAVSD